jgi:hypothetical protein
MMSTDAILALLATLVLGIAAGILHLQRLHRPLVVKAHLVAALAALAVVGLAVLGSPRDAAGGPPGLLPPAMVAVAVAAGYGAFRLRGIGQGGSQAMLIGHLALGIAAFFVFLAWAKIG